MKDKFNVRKEAIDSSLELYKKQSKSVKTRTQHYGPGEGFSPPIHGQSMKRLRKRTGGVFRCLRYIYTCYHTMLSYGLRLELFAQAATRTIK